MDALGAGRPVQATDRLTAIAVGDSGEAVSVAGSGGIALVSV